MLQFFSVSKSFTSLRPKKSVVNLNRTSYQNYIQLGYFSTQQTQSFKKLNIFFGSQTGTSQSFANQLAEEGTNHHLESKIIDLKDYKEEDFSKDSLNVFFVSTYGEGEPTDNAKPFFQWLQEKNSPLVKDLPYTIFGCGRKSSYAKNYQKAPKNLEALFQSKGAKEIFQRGEGNDDDDIETDFLEWKENFWKAFEEKTSGSSTEEARPAPTPSPPKPSAFVALGTDVMEESPKQPEKPDHQNPAIVTVQVNKELHSAESVRSSHHVEFDISQTPLTYTTGDHIGIFPENSPILVEQFAKRLNLDLNLKFTLNQTPQTAAPKILNPCSMSTFLSKYYDLQSVVGRSLLALSAKYASNPKEKAFLDLLHPLTPESKELYQNWVFSNKRTFLEILRQFSSIQNIPVEELVPELAKQGLQYRYYSIASSSLKNPKKAAVCVGVCTDVTPTGRIHHGVCSHYLQNLKLGTLSQVVVRTAQNFRLPQDPSKPIILVGGGTGIAPLRGMIEERHYQRTVLKQNVGPTLLFFGCYHEKEDFLYAQELEEWQRQGTLKLTTAFSNDQVEPMFVQHRLLENASLVWDLIKNKGSHIYVCGNALKVGTGVRNMLIQIAEVKEGLNFFEAQDYINSLTANGRFQVDVF